MNKIIPMWLPWMGFAAFWVYSAFTDPEGYKLRMLGFLLAAVTSLFISKHNTKLIDQETNVRFVK